MLIITSDPAKVFTGAEFVWVCRPSPSGGAIGCPMSPAHTGHASARDSTVALTIFRIMVFPRNTLVQ